MLERTRQRVSDFAADWATPILMGLTTAAVVWTIWYLTKAPCTTAAAANGLCHPGVIARFINVEILLQSGGAALAVGALKGGYDRGMMRRMINEEREARQAAEQHLAEQIAEQRKRSDEAFAMLTEMFNEFREERREERRRADEERRRADEERRRADEEHRLTIATQQALLDVITRLTQRNGNGNGSSENGGS